jgi:hypothetical protein
LSRAASLVVAALAAALTRVTTERAKRQASLAAEDLLRVLGFPPLAVPAREAR